MFGQYSYENGAGESLTKDEMAPYTAVKTRKAGHNRIVIWYEDGSKAFRLKQTDVVRVWPSGRVRLVDGGWQTMTTRRAMSQGLKAILGVDVAVWGNKKTRKGVTTYHAMGRHQFACPYDLDACKAFGLDDMPDLAP